VSCRAPKRFLAPQLAQLIVSHGEEGILESHRREIVVVFCDLAGRGSRGTATRPALCGDEVKRREPIFRT
jgi:hypothetical protein